MRLSLVLSIAFMSITLACSQKSVQETPSAKIEEAGEVLSDKEMVFSGYRNGVVVENSELSAPCNYNINLGEAEMIEALNFPEDFQIDGLKVWVKYSMQRRPAECPGAQPVDIIDLKKIED